MATGPTILLAKTNVAAVSKAFSLTMSSKDQGATIIINGLSGTNKAYLQIQDPLDLSWNNLLLNGNPIYCDLNNSVIFIGAEGLYRINKLGTDNVGVSIQSSMPINIFN